MEHPGYPPLTRRAAALWRRALAGLIVLAAAALAVPARGQPLPVDPVVPFQQALKARRDFNDPTSRAAKFFFKARRARLTEAAAAIKSLPDLSRALRSEWQPVVSPGERRRGEDPNLEIELEVRSTLTKRFVRSAQAQLKDTSEESLVAAANLISETMRDLSAPTLEEQQLARQLSPLVDDLAGLVKKGSLPPPRAREALCRALSQFPPNLEEPGDPYRVRAVDPDSKVLTVVPSGPFALDKDKERNVVIDKDTKFYGPRRRPRKVNLKGPGLTPRGPYHPEVRLVLSDDGKTAQEVYLSPRQVLGSSNKGEELDPITPVVVPMLERFLASDNPEDVRIAAANGLVRLVRLVSGRETPAVSEPGVTLREARGVGQLFLPQPKLEVVVRVIPAAARGLTDSSARVRRACAEALAQSATTLAEMVPRPPSPDPVDRLYPPPDRELLTPEEREAVEEGHEVEAELRPGYSRFAAVVPALIQVLRDPDVQARREAATALEEAGRARRLLRHHQKDLPPLREEKKDDEDKKKDKGVARRLPARKARPAGAAGDPAPVLHRVAYLPAELPAPARRVAGKVRRQAEDRKDGTEELLTGPLAKSVRELAQQALTDRDPVVRRLAVSALEALGDEASIVLPEIVRALCDRDLFVRWIAARTLGGLAPRQPDLVVPALVKAYDDLDLDLRNAIATALGKYGPDASAAVPTLSAAVGRGDSEARTAAMRTLENIGKAAATALPNIARQLSNEDPRVRSEAARVLGRFGKLAQDQLPALRARAFDPDQDVRRSVNEAILRIIEAP